MRRHPGPGSWTRPALILLALAYLTLIGWMARRPVQTDFAKFYSSACQLLRGEDPYSKVDPRQLGLEADSEAGRDWEGVHPNLNPPFAALLTAPLGWLPFSPAFWIWSLLSLLSGVVAVRLLTQDGPKLNFPVWLLLLFGYFPTWVNVKYGQVSLFLLLALTLTKRFARSGRDLAAGALFGATVSVKLFAGLFLLHFLVRGRWKLLAAAALTGLGCWALGLAASDWETYRRYREALDFVTWQAANWNASFNGFFSRIFGGSESVPLLEASSLSRPLASVSSLLAALTLVLASSSMDTRGEPRTDVGFSVTVPLMLLISPLGWIYYFPLLLIPMADAWRNLPADESGKRHRTWLAAAWLTTSFPSWFVTADQITPASFGFAGGIVHTLSLVFFTGVLMMTAWSLNSKRIRREVTAPADRTRGISASAGRPEK